ncbi:anti-sigma factor [Acetivibrio thermocellus]|uniref:anti-sigma factor family protein n=1 Tax=Acetivibrio thermocellus TaxID=1515 RepID=UPI0010A5EA40|nr:zf-HC2 domain-containing protein [Acetivibrio thermocellus]THJ77305.1 anti-sigma factor [Acetivibrio thermocellus]
MKNCGEIIELMSLYIDGELDSETKREFEEHIETCESCRSELYELKEIVDVLGEVEEVELPSGFKEQLHEKLVAEKKKNESESKILSFRKKFIGFAPSIAAGLVLVFVAASLIITRGLFGNVPSTNTGGSMGIEYSRMMESDQKNNKDGQYNGLKNEEDSQVSVLFNEEPGATQSQKFYDGAEDSLQKEKSEDARKIENSSFYEITSSSDVPASEQPQKTYSIAATGMTVYDVNITVNSPDLEKDTDNIINIARSCNVEIEVEIEKSGHKSVALSGLDENKNTLNFSMDAATYENFISKLKEEYGSKLSLDEKTDDSEKTKRVEITIFKE